MGEAMLREFRVFSCDLSKQVREIGQEIRCQAVVPLEAVLLLNQIRDCCDVLPRDTLQTEKCVVSKSLPSVPSRALPTSIKG